MWRPTRSNLVIKRTAYLPWRGRYAGFLRYFLLYTIICGIFIVFPLDHTRQIGAAVVREKPRKDQSEHARLRPGEQIGREGKKSRRQERRQKLIPRQERGPRSGGTAQDPPDRGEKNFTRPDCRRAVLRPGVLPQRA